ncbi:protein diaphanous homolog 1-like [Osmerus mordax]|uniref:protein diaphanous homolog 1-like n=1 Tax=Osmerus mordax TaxID=8014 RepID=UPI00350F3304
MDVAGSLADMMNREAKTGLQMTARSQDCYRVKSNEASMPDKTSAPRGDFPNVRGDVHPHDGYETGYNRDDSPCQIISVTEEPVTPPAPATTDQPDETTDQDAQPLGPPHPPLVPYRTVIPWRPNVGGGWASANGFPRSPTWFFGSQGNARFHPAAFPLPGNAHFHPAAFPLPGNAHFHPAAFPQPGNVHFPISSFLGGYDPRLGQRTSGRPYWPRGLGLARRRDSSEEIYG